MQENFLDIFPQRHPNTDYDASLEAIIRNRDGALIKVNETGLVIWQLCDGTQSVEDILDTACSSYYLNRDDAIESIVPLLQHLHDQQCLTFKQRIPDFSAPPTPPLVNFFPLPADLLHHLEEYRRLCEPLFPEEKDPDDSQPDGDKLEQVINETIPMAVENFAFRDLTFASTPTLNPLLESVAELIHDLVPLVGAKRVKSGQALYGAGGSMGWHTNEDMPGLRIYCTWAEKAGTNYFRYRDPDSGEIVTLPETQGWTVKSFYIPPRPRQLWHCLYAGSRRIAIGFADFEFQRIDQIIES